VCAASLTLYQGGHHYKSEKQVWYHPRWGKWWPCHWWIGEITISEGYSSYISWVEVHML